MFMKFLGLLLMGSQLVSPTFSQDYNPRLLDMNADELSRKVCSGTPIPREDIQSKLDFIYNEEALIGKVRDFEGVYAKMIPLITDSNFASFAGNCKEIYDTGDNKTKITLGILFKAVSDKSSVQFKRLQKLRRAKEVEQTQQTVRASELPKYFEKADKTVPLGVVAAADRK